MAGIKNFTEIASRKDTFLIFARLYLCSKMIKYVYYYRPWSIENFNIVYSHKPYPAVEKFSL